MPPDSNVDIAAVAAQLRRTRPWVRFLAIVGFVSVVFMIVGGLGAGAVGLATGSPEAAVLLFVYPLIGVIYVYPSLCLLRYANAIQRFIGSPEGGHLEAALDAQRSFWQFAGIFTAISVAASIVGVLLAVFIGILFGLPSS